MLIRTNSRGSQQILPPCSFCCSIEEHFIRSLLSSGHHLCWHHFLEPCGTFFSCSYWSYLSGFPALPTDILDGPFIPTVEKKRSFCSCSVSTIHATHCDHCLLPCKLPCTACPQLCIPPQLSPSLPPQHRQDSWSSACTIWEQRSHYVKFRVSPETFYLQITENYIWRLGRKALNPSLEQVNKEKRQRASFTDLLYNLHLWTTPADLSRSCLWKHRPRKAQRPECTHLFAHKQTAFPNSQQLPGPNSASHHLLVPNTWSYQSSPEDLQPSAHTVPAAWGEETAATTTIPPQSDPKATITWALLNTSTSLCSLQGLQVLSRMMTAFFCCELLNFNHFY